MGSEDFVRAVRLAMTDKSMNGIYNLGSPLPMSIYGFAELVCEVSGASLVMEKRTNNLIPSPISIHFPDTKKLEFHGWDRHQTLDDAVEKTLREIRIQANL
jgi:nucleoside-diphosphate-sugar epimerase